MYLFPVLCVEQSDAQVPSAGTEYCFPRFIEWNQNEEEEEYCNECNLGIWKIRLNSPFGWVDKLFEQYTSLTASCNAAPSWAVTSSISQFMLGYLPTGASPSAATKQVSTYNLMRVNNLPTYCGSFPGPGTRICIPETCPVHTVFPLDTCEKIAKAKGVTTQQLISWNPNINPGCSNLYNMVGYVICVGPLGTVATTTALTTFTPVPTTMFTDPCLNLGAETIASCYVPTLPSESAVAWPTVTWNGISNETDASTTVPSSPSAAPTVPLAAGTWTNCTHYATYMDVPANTSYLDFSNPNYCLMRAILWNIELEQLLRWNPSLPEMVNETRLDSCMLEEGFQYCVDDGGGMNPPGPSTMSPPSLSSAVPSSGVSGISSLSTSLALVPTPNSNCVLGAGPGSYQGLCDFSCHFGWCPSPCTCTTTGTPAPPPALLTSVKNYNSGRPVE
ncbi:hypothetical protein QBC36DRAFT_383025 [Triangularia setosa]|uniref:LysM domain-containing protein n=1 Tax=Triangularia setosa TaxID=2587417 RepID=A0AAN6VW58_9PEZI|nr:hypothetical protein QBC36DRAFT_383025 [Podospora setosa]